MSPKPKSEVIRRFIVDHVTEHPQGIAKVTAEAFGITRQAVYRHLTILVEDEVLEVEGRGRAKTYALKSITTGHEFNLTENRDEDKVWREFIQPVLGELPENIIRICHYGFTEIYNNSVDHSEGSKIFVALRRSVKSVKILIQDNGIGIFEKLKTVFELDDHRHAILELSKGKLTSDPRHHSGQGIFFTSRMFDQFFVIANHLGFIHKQNEDDWLIEGEPSSEPGTLVSMEIATDSKRTAREVFDRYTDLESGDYEFSKTHVPLSLVKYGSDSLISRSQAKRVLARFDRFEEVFLDFEGVESVGQAFADEIFRVFYAYHPEIEIVAINANEQVWQMIRRAIAAREPSKDDE